jgi:hypothetical protein
MHLLTMVYFRFCQHCETAVQTHTGEAGLPLDSSSGGSLPCYVPIHAYPQPRERFVVDTDASNVEIGGVPSKTWDGWERVIA